MGPMVQKSENGLWAYGIVLIALSCTQTLLGQNAHLDDTGRTAAYLLRNSTKIDRNGHYHKQLEALRQMRDPALEPLFRQLIQSGQPSLMIHGVLGLAESSQGQKLDLTEVAAITSATVQAQIVSAAMDKKLLTDEQAQQLLDWPDLDRAVKIVAAAQLIKNLPPNLDFLKADTKPENLARRSLAALLKVQLGQPGAMEELRLLLNRSQDRQRDRVCQMLLETALRYELDRVAPWAAELAARSETDRWLGLLALRVAMRFGWPGAIDSWRQRFAGATDPAQRMRLALLALGLAPWLDAGLFIPLTNDNDLVIQKIGHAGAAIASGEGIDVAIVNLIELRHPMASRWALTYAKNHATATDAQIILLGLIMAFEDYPSNRQARAFNLVSLAARAMHKSYPQAAVKLLRPLLADPETDPVLTQAMLLGLIGSSTPGADDVVAGLESVSSPQVNQLMVLLLAKHSRPLSPKQHDALEIMVRGGGGVQDSLRLQAAWAYLKQTRQSQLALASAVRR